MHAHASTGSGACKRIQHGQVRWPPCPAWSMRTRARGCPAFSKQA